jgi:hypothetical protein
MTQRELLIDFFHSHGNVLMTADFGKHPVLWSEYRRLLSSTLPRHGYRVDSEKVTAKNWKYTLVSEPQAWKSEANGQLAFA